MFWIIMLIGISLVVMQGVLAYKDGYFTQLQMRHQDILEGYSFMEHGGMLSDVFIITPLVAYIVSTYKLNYMSWESLIIFLISIGISLFAGISYNKSGSLTPEAHTHDGKTTPTGWVHGIYAIPCFWVVMLFYVEGALNHLIISANIILLISAILMGFSYLGVVKFNKNWKFKKQDRVQMYSLDAVIIFITAIIYFRLF